MIKPILEFCAIFVVGVLNHVMGSFFFSKRPDFRNSFTVTENLLREWGASLAAISVVLLVAIDQPLGLASVGILTSQSARNDKFNHILISLLSISIFVIVFSGVQNLANHLRKTSPERKVDLSNPTVTGLFQYRSSLEKIAHLSVLSFGVISEDLIYRGYLVLLLGNLTHNYLPWIFLSVALSIVVHLYQGRKFSSILFQAIFSLFFIGLTLWTGSILTPIIAHLCYDISWTLGIWKTTNKAENTAVTHSRLAVIAYSLFICINILILWMSLRAVS